MRFVHAFTLHTGVQNHLLNTGVQRSSLGSGMILDEHDGHDLVLDLQVELLKMRRQKMVALARCVLNARCPGIGHRIENDDDVLREAGYALSIINQDIEDAQDELVNFRAMRNAIAAIEASR